MTVDIDALEKLIAKATPGPWSEREEHDDYHRFAGIDGLPSAKGWREEVVGSLSFDDAAAIVALRNAAPEFIRRLRAAERVVDAARYASESQPHTLDALDAAVAAYDEARWASLHRIIRHFAESFSLRPRNSVLLYLV